MYLSAGHKQAFLHAQQSQARPAGSVLEGILNIESTSVVLYLQGDAAIQLGKQDADA